MSISPIITFKAGLCDLDTTTSPPKVKPLPTPGYIYIYNSDDDLLHFCWRPRSATLDSPELDLFMFPSDGSFTPYEPTSSQKPSNPKKPTNGRIYVLKFSSSSQRHFFWLQSRSQHESGDPAWFSARDLKLGQIVNTLLQGENIDVQQAIANLPADQNGPDGDDDETMEDVEGQNHDTEHHRGGSGGAGPGATGGDIREEGHEAREGGADGGRAMSAGAMDANTIIQNFIKSMPGGQQGSQESLFTTLADLLIPASTIPFIESADTITVDRLLAYLPPSLVSLAQEADVLSTTTQDLTPIDSSVQVVTLEQKKDILRRVLRSPQLSQSLSSLTIALRDGGLPSLSEALGIPVRNGGFMSRGGVPLGGGDAVEAFLDGVKEQVEKDGNMDIEPIELVNLQRVSRRLLKLARDSPLWLSKCFYRSPCAATSTNARHSSSGLSGLFRQTGSKEPDESGATIPSEQQSDIDVAHRSNTSGRARAIANWDLTNDLEKVDWYSEYIARHATLTATWFRQGSSPLQEVRGLAVSKDSTRAFGPLEDGTLCVWDVEQTAAGHLHTHRAFREISRSPPSILFQDHARASEASANQARLEFSGDGECIAIKSDQQRAYVAVGDILNEVDLETFQVVSQNNYAWPITALSQEDTQERPLTVGTSWSLHVHDPRLQSRWRSCSPEDVMISYSIIPEDSIAFLPNYTKGISRRFESEIQSEPAASAARFASALPLLSTLPSNAMSNWQSPFASSSGPFFGPHFGSPSPKLRRSTRLTTLSQYAQCEPGPLSIIHQGHDNIFIAGRFPSILSYDRRFFPKLQYVVHSGARLAALATLPYQPCRAMRNTGIEATLIACGEYNGCGSLELYSLPHLKQNMGHGTSAEIPEDLEDTADGISPEAERALSTSMELVGRTEPYNYKNRQTASRAKLLSVATQGTRIVFSDAEGGIKWVERDGYGLVRRWNVNDFEMHDNSASLQGEQVVRKIIPVNPPDSDNGARGDGDLLVWTGEKIGVITTQQPHDHIDDLRAAFDDTLGKGDMDLKADEYARAMRRALERQADERRWMSRFNMRYR